MVRRFPLVLLLVVACTTAPVRPEGSPDAARPVPADVSLPESAAAPAPAHLEPLPPEPETQALDEAHAAVVEAAMAAAQSVRGLSFLQPVEKRLGNRELVEWLVRKELRKSMDDDTFAADQAMLEAFGFIRPGADLAELLVGVYGEQVRGVYDHETDVLYVIPGVEADETAIRKEALPGISETLLFLLHELVHALQDQHFGLDAFMDPALTEDAGSAGRALVEGDATYAMYDYLLRTLAKQELVSVADLGPIKAQVAMALADPGNAELRRAPLYLREAMLFAYVDGFLFAHALMRAGGVERLDAAYASPPATTEQVLHPEKYLAGEEALPVRLQPSAALAAAGFTPADQGTLGELGLRIFLANLAELGEAPAAPTPQGATEPTPQGAAEPTPQGAAEPTPQGATEQAPPGSGWGGDRYVVYVHPQRTPAAVWSLRFDTEPAADAFTLEARSRIESLPDAQVRRLSPDRVVIVTHLPPELAEQALAEAAADAQEP